MAKIKFIANWTSIWQIHTKKGFISLKPQKFYIKPLTEIFKKLKNYQLKQYEKMKKQKNIKDIKYEDWLKDLEITIEYHYRKRTLDQNALMWALYEIEANEMNAGMKGHKDQNITSMKIYLNDLNEYGEEEIITTKRKNLGYYLSEYRIIKSVVYNDTEYDIETFKKQIIHDDAQITLYVIRSTSKFNTKEMANWIDRIFNRIAHNGVNVTQPGDILHYWQNWKKYLNDEKIILHDEIMTQTEYKSYQPICEGCGKFIGNGSGQLAHIKAIGMGSDRTAEHKKNYTSNWLHLCFDCHNKIWHQQGIRKFLKLFEHLTYKVNSALRRDYEIIQEKELDLF